ncbi:MAG: dethiobiotin synthase [Bacillota bacterium]
MLEAPARTEKPSLPSLFITGTDTGVGKTIVSALISLIYRAAGATVAYLKPVETGTARVGEDLIPGDTTFVASLLELNEPEEMLCPYRFEPAASPHLAARLANRKIKPTVIEECFKYLERRYNAVIVEGAGGLLVPLKPGYLMADLVRDLGLPLVITARPGLGTINHTLLTIAAAVQAEIPVAGVVINRYPENPDPVAKDNPRTISSFSGIPVLALVPEIPGLDPRRPHRALLEETARSLEETHRLVEALAGFAAGQKAAKEIGPPEIAPVPPEE